MSAIWSSTFSKYSTWKGEGEFSELDVDISGRAE
jgi:hypothetical protein